MIWKNIINSEQNKIYYKKLDEFIEEQYRIKTIYPLKNNIFKAFNLCEYKNLKVVILGQDPYHKYNQAQGLAFSTPKNIKNPPSLINILKEIKNDLKYDSLSIDGDLTSLAKQGVLLLNTILTVEDSKPNSHKNKGWEIFTNNIISYISNNNKNIIFLLWGAYAIKKIKIINKNNHYILTAPHPSPLSSYRGFFGCNHFSKTNQILKKLNKNEIKW
jgi:uracil-DNA glycosylase